LFPGSSSHSVFYMKRVDGTQSKAVHTHSLLCLIFKV
jgi:hypothetical protein